MVYIIGENGQPLMPTERHGKVRRLLRDGKAKVIRRCPFTIQLQYETTNYTQEVNLGIDAGSKHIGVSVTTKDKVLYEADVELRNDINASVGYKDLKLLNKRSNYLIEQRKVG